MVSHESDIETEKCSILLNDVNQILNLHITNIRKYQRAITQLNMIMKQEVDSDGIVQITHTLPNDRSGDIIDDDYRVKQKAELCINAYRLLEELDGFLPKE